MGLPEPDAGIAAGAAAAAEHVDDDTLRCGVCKWASGFDRIGSNFHGI
jgi:hypothetical protein